MINMVQYFTNDERTVIGFETSPTDRKMVKFKMLDNATHLFDDYKLLFASIYDKHYFAELFFLGSSYHLPMAMTGSHLSKKDLRMHVMTWNNGGKNVKGFSDNNLQLIIPNLKDYDIVVFAF